MQGSISWTKYPGTLEPEQVYCGGDEGVDLITHDFSPRIALREPPSSRTVILK